MRTARRLEQDIKSNWKGSKVLLPVWSNIVNVTRDLVLSYLYKELYKILTAGTPVSTEGDE